MQIDIPAERQRFPHQIGTPLPKCVVCPHTFCIPWITSRVCNCFHPVSSHVTTTAPKAARTTGRNPATGHAGRGVAGLSGGCGVNHSFHSRCGRRCHSARDSASWTTPARMVASLIARYPSTSPRCSTGSMRIADTARAVRPRAVTWCIAVVSLLP